jgi:hypothetical protein
MQFLPILIGWMGIEGCQCTPSIPPPDEPPPPDPTGNTGNTGDTGPAPPCAWPEVEPNNTVLEPTLLGMEQRGCGGIDPEGDQDYWSFTLEEDAWLEVEVDAGNGSIADMALLLAKKLDDWTAARDDDPESLNATMLFPAPAGEYLLTTTEQDGGGGERYTYTVLVSEAKAPVTWMVTEVEPNDNEGNQTLPANINAENISNLLALGPLDIYGTMSGNGPSPDQDWFVLTVPSGRHTLTVDVEAFDYGSSADLTVTLWNDDLTDKIKEYNGGIPGLELDPEGTYDSSGDELVFIQVTEAANIESPANWYVLKIVLVEET